MSRSSRCFPTVTNVFTASFLLGRWMLNSLSHFRIARARRRVPSGFLRKAICCATPCAPFRLLLRRGLSHSIRFTPFGSFHSVPGIPLYSRLLNSSLPFRLDFRNAVAGSSQCS
jgi:hypothetical protein